MKKYPIILLTFFTFCSQDSNIETLDETSTTTVETSVEVLQVEPELYVML